MTSVDFVHLNPPHSSILPSFDEMMGDLAHQCPLELATTLKV